MRYLKYFALLAVLMLPLSYSQAQVRVGVGLGYGPGYYGGPPACAYGYYDYYPYACAPYGFYGPNWFASGVFIGAGPWYRPYWGQRAWGPGWGRGFYGRPGWGRGYSGRGYYGRGPAFGGRGFVGRGQGFHGGSGGGSFHGGGRR